MSDFGLARIIGTFFWTLTHWIPLAFEIPVKITLVGGHSERLTTQTGRLV